MDIVKVELPEDRLRESCFVDLSWLMHRYSYALKNLSVQNSSGQTIPTGHVQGTLKTILSLSTTYSLRGKDVILCVDSKSNKAALYAQYKKNRDSSGKYSIYNDLTGILIAACTLPNVYYCKEDGYEADDFINSAVHLKLAPEIMGRDADLLVTKGDFRYFQDIYGNKPSYVDVQEYLKTSKSIDLPFYPIWAMILRGKGSNNMPGAFPRFPTKTLQRVCKDLLGGQSLGEFAKYCLIMSNRDRSDLYDSNLEKCVRDPAIWEKIKLNHSLVLPQYVDPLVFKRVSEPAMLKQFFQDKQLNSLAQFWGF